MSKLKMPEPVTATSSTVKATTEAVRPSKPKTKSSIDGLPFLFDKQNYLWMGIGLVVIVLGYVLMSGGRSDDPNFFDADSLYSFRRITLAPFLIILGLIIEMYAIMKKPSEIQ